MTGLLCPLCSTSHFDTLDTLRSRLIKAATQNIPCPVCGELLLGLDKLTIHLFGHSLQEEPPSTVNTDHLSQLTNGEPYKNLYVEIKSPTTALLQLNIQDDWQRVEKPSFVFEGDTGFLREPENLGEVNSDFEISKESKLEHDLDELFKTTTSASDSPKPQLEIKQNEEIGDDTKDDETNICRECGKWFKMRGSLVIHTKVAHGGKWFDGSEARNFHCTLCSKSFKKEQHLGQHMKTHDGKQWQCETCYKFFTTKYFLKKHQRLHTGEMPYCCETCGKAFTFQQSYHKHLLYHSTDKPHECRECGRSFKELSTLHNHQRIHSGEKPFACETCGKSFRQRVSYIVHQRIHTGVLPYQCTACFKKFRYKVSQRSHKCTAQPPGVVVRQPGDLIQRLLQQRNLLPCQQ